MDSLQIRLLGPLQILCDGNAVKFRAPTKAAALLAYLIVHRAQASPRDATAFALWPDSEEVKARANLRRHIALLQQILPPLDSPAILVEQRSIQWNPLFYPAVDVCEFERLSATEGNAREAIALYKGDLASEIYEDWLLPERGRLRSLQTVNLERLSQQFRLAGDYSNAILTAKALLDHDPWREDTIRYLISLRYEAGDRAGALREYEQFANRLQKDLQVAPMPETIARYDAIIRNGPVSSNNVASPATPVFAVGNSPFVGRTGELAQLRDCWLRAMRGHGRFVFLTGEAGIGKSRLASEFGNLVESQGGRVVLGATTFAEKTPYQAIVQTLRGALPMINALDLEPIWLAAAATVLPELRHMYPALPALSTLEPDREQSRLFEGMWHCFAGLAQIRPLLVILEDLHWAGKATISFLNYMASRVEATPIVVLVTYRDTETETKHPLRVFRREVQREHRIINVPLGGLSVSEVERFIEGIPSLRFGEFSNRAHRLSAGNPFFLGEIVRELTTTGAQVATLPESVHLAIDGRINRLSNAARSLLGVASIVGEAFTTEILTAASGFSEHEAIPCLDELLDSRLIRFSTRTAGDTPYDFAFSHDLIQARTYATVAPATRKILHRRVATVMEEINEGRPDVLVRELARHFNEGGEPARAARYYYEWAKAALAVHAHEEALNALCDAIVLTDDQHLHYDAMALRETVYSRLGVREKQLRDIEELEKCVDDGQQQTRNVESLRRRILYARAVNDVVEQERSTSRLRDITMNLGDRYWDAFCMENAAVLTRMAGRYDAALVEAKSALAAYKNADDSSGRTRSLCLIADLYGLQGSQEASRAAIEEGLALAASSSNEALMIGSLDAASSSAYRNNDYDTCEALTHKGLVLCQAIGDREGEADAYFRLGNVFGRRFAIDTATEYYDKATAFYDAVNKPLGKAMVLVNTGVLLLKVGGLASALQSFVRSRVLFHRLRDLRGRTICTINLGMTAYLMGRFEAARRISRAARTLAEELGTPALVCAALSNLGAAERELDDLPSALRHCEQSMRLRREKAATDIASDLADLGLTYLRCENLPAALAVANEICALEDGALESVMYPQEVMWKVACIFAGAQLGIAYRKALKRAGELRQARIDAIPAGSLRESYGELRFNQEIERAIISERK
jgi:DNA-binding SARP family transcriptional activator/energy-coupling factor transporter ATP-binding protein EcfA2